jgi:indolepyruvate ferredoxin oxidoreductase, beta subunit
VTDTINMVLCGLGGQGILFMTRILAHTGLDRGLNLMGAETHGMAQRGGSVVSHLRFGNVEGSLVRTGTAHYLLALEENEAYRNLPFLSRGGKMYVNTNADHFPREEVRGFLAKKEIFYRSFPAGSVALELGAALSSNLAMLGYFSAFDNTPFGPEELRGVIEKISPVRFSQINLKIFDAGLERAMEEKGA